MGEMVLSSPEMAVPALLFVGVGYRPEAWSALRQVLFVGGIWRLFRLVFVPVGVLGLYRFVVDPALRAPMYTVLLAAFLLVCLFVFTEPPQRVVSFTIVNRLLLHLVQMAVFVVWLVVRTAPRGMRRAPFDKSNSGNADQGLPTGSGRTASK